jgi:hypothetical protein
MNMDRMLNVMTLLSIVLILLVVAWRKRRPIAGLGIALCAILFVIKFQTIPQKAKNGIIPDRPNVLVLMMDSLRPSRISYNGHFRPTPNIDRLFRELIALETDFPELASPDSPTRRVAPNLRRNSGRSNTSFPSTGSVEEP